MYYAVCLIIVINFASLKHSMMWNLTTINKHLLTELGAVQTICVGVVDFFLQGDPAIVTLSSSLKPYPVRVTSIPPIKKKVILSFQIKKYKILLISFLNLVLSTTMLDRLWYTCTWLYISKHLLIFFSNCDEKYYFKYLRD